ncbi:MAG: helix-turn-helix transcriptional regulator, partial [Lentisphaeria bacterium]|nr:helix-turn-helix transcriptional regulator [Lentisphaeria bacterium]
MAKSSNRDAAATKAAIITAAEELFAERGFAGTSINKISEKSGASGPLIIFHFKGKNGLYEAVKVAIVKRYSECLPAPLDSNKPFHESLENIVKSMFSFYK